MQEVGFFCFYGPFMKTQVEWTFTCLCFSVIGIVMLILCTLPSMLLKSIYLYKLEKKKKDKGSIRAFLGDIQFHALYPCTISVVCQFLMSKIDCFKVWLCFGLFSIPQKCTEVIS